MLGRAQIGGQVTYNGEPLDQLYAERTAAYVPQDDVHIAKLQVQETLDFSARCKVGLQASHTCSPAVLMMTLPPTFLPCQ